MTDDDTKAPIFLCIKVYSILSQVIIYHLFAIRCSEYYPHCETTPGATTSICCPFRYSVSSASQGDMAFLHVKLCQPQEYNLSHPIPDKPFVLSTVTRVIIERIDNHYVS